MPSAHRSAPIPELRFYLRTEAEAAGRDVTRERKVEHIIKNMDGKIASRNTYGHDPRNIPG